MPCRFAVLAPLALVAAGCCTITRGRTVIVPVTSDPPGAHVTVSPGGEETTTPGAVALRRKLSYVLRVEKPGYAPASVPLRSRASWGLFRNVVWIHPAGWIAGTLIDVGNGSGYDLEPAAIDVSLQPVPVDGAR